MQNKKKAREKPIVFFASPYIAIIHASVFELFKKIIRIFFVHVFHTLDYKSSS